MKNRGFTLIEALLAVTLFTIVISSSFAIFSIGIQIWKRTQGASLAERKAVLALEKMGADIRMSLRPKGGQEIKWVGGKMKFAGDEKGFGLPAIVNVTGRTGARLTQYGRISYQWNSAGVLCRMTEGATDFYLERKSVCSPAAEHIQRAKFRYWIYDGIGDSFSWHDSWEYSESLPQAIEVTLELEHKEFQQVFFIPAGGKPLNVK